jgi:cytochrome c-type biogenesis protein CcmH/NrfG
MPLAFANSLAVAHLALARRAADLWLRLRPSQADQMQGLVWRGRLHLFALEQAEAQAALRKALELDPDHFEARLQLALAVTQEAPAEAAAHLQLLRDRHPKNNHVRLLLATHRRVVSYLR